MIVGDIINLVHDDVQIAVLGESLLWVIPLQVLRHAVP